MTAFWVAVSVLAASCASAALTAFFFARRIRRVSLYVDSVLEKRPASNIHRDFKGAFAPLLTNIDRAAEALHDRIRAADGEKNRILAILEGMAEAVAVIDGEERILLANSAFTVAFGVGADQVRGRFFWEAIRDPEINDLIVAALSSRAASRILHKVLLTQKVFEIRLSPVFLNEEFLGVAAVFHDLTKIHELERMRREFVANVSHELKTPLTSIMGFVETLKEGAMEDVDARGRFLGIIDEHTKKLHTLIEELLSLSQIESEERPIKKERIDIHELFQKLIEMLGPSIRSLSLKVEDEISGPFWVHGDRLLLERALGNLLTNAVKYNKSGGRIFVGAAVEGGRPAIWVRDTGIGIPAQDLERIFERFYRVDKSRARESGGSGLGLAIAKHIFERHGGIIQVQSRLSEGSEFKVYLPAESLTS